MARVEEKQAFTSTYAPITEGSHQGGDVDMDEIASPSGCCCFGFGGGRKGNQESKSLLQQNNDNNGESLHRGSWFVNKLKKLKEFSELLAGPKWKNFIRKIGKYCRPKKSSKTQCMYSPHSYALNFADGDDEEEEDDLFVSFSSRFSAPLSSDKQRATTTSS